MSAAADWKRAGIEASGVLVVFVAAGFGAGWLWERIWTPNTGVVYMHEWLEGSRLADGGIATSYTAERRDFDAVAIFVLVGALTALVLGVVCALVARRLALVTLLAVGLGSVLACYIAYRFGTHLAPPDPEGLAKTSADFTVLPGNLEIGGSSPFVAWPLGALVGLMTVNFLTSGPGATSMSQDSSGTDAGIAAS